MPPASILQTQFCDASSEPYVQLMFCPDGVPRLASFVSRDIIAAYIVASSLVRNTITSSGSSQSGTPSRIWSSIEFADWHPLLLPQFIKFVQMSHCFQLTHFNTSTMKCRNKCYSCYSIYFGSDPLLHSRNYLLPRFHRHVLPELVIKLRCIKPKMSNFLIPILCRLYSFVVGVALLWEANASCTHQLGSYSSWWSCFPSQSWVEQTLVHQSLLWLTSVFSQVFLQLY